MFAGNATMVTVAQTAGQRCLALRTAFEGITDFENWLTAQADADLTALGFSTQDITFLRSAFADLNDLATKYNGGAGTIALPYNYTVNSKQVIGPQ